MKFSTDCNGRDRHATMVWLEVPSGDDQQTARKLLVPVEDSETLSHHAIALDCYSRHGQLDPKSQTFHLAVLRT